MQRPPSSDAASEVTGPAQAPLIEAGRWLAERGVYGFIWLDEALIVTARFGRLVDFVEIGLPVTDSLPPLVGLESAILALAAAPEASLDLPAVAIVGPERSTPRLNLSFFRLPDSHQFLIAASRAIPRSDLESELSKHMRGRLIAESELKAKSRELAQLNVELSIANRDLEQFASIISHDLASPMRALRYAAEELETLVPAGAAAEARLRVAELRRLTRRMSQMMGGLLDYSSAGRKSDALEDVDTLALAEGIAASVPRADGVRVEVAGTWPVMRTLAAPLDLVLRNLVDNAVKYHDRDQGTVRLTAAPRADRALQISVADDGPGIARELHEAIFQPFRRGVSVASEVPGEGLGLALVRRTLESVGGRISLYSDPASGRGTRFEIVWPAAKPDAVAQR